MILRYLLCAIIGYLLGSISTGILYSKYILGKDVRTAGSKNAGTSNMLRVHGFKPGFITFTGDCLKAILSIAAGRMLCGLDGALIAGLFVVLGHNWPLYFSFQGGKGIACCSAIFILCFPVWGIIAVVCGVAMIAITRYISLGSLVMTTVFAILLIFAEPFWPVGIWSIVLMALAYYRHRGNIARLINGTERKIGQKEQ